MRRGESKAFSRLFPGLFCFSELFLLTFSLNNEKTFLNMSGELQNIFVIAILSLCVLFLLVRLGKKWRHRRRPACHCSSCPAKPDLPKEKKSRRG